MGTLIGSSDGGFSRRSFIGRTGAALLAGAAFARGMGLDRAIAQPDSGRYRSVTIRTHEWCGDIDERLDFPRDWEIDYITMAGHDTPSMTGDELRASIRTPVGTSRLAEIAAGKKTAVVTFDDMTRPTPVGTVAKYVIEELNEAGIDDDHILFLGSFGTHQLLDQIDVRAKLGEDIVTRCPWINHNVYDNLLDVGRTTYGNRVEINNYFMNADVKVTISGVKVHSAAGYGGGAKAIIPGICSFDTTYFNHGVIAGYGRNSTSSIGNRNQTMGAGKLTKNEFRLDMEEAARLAGVDFSVQIVYNGRREPVRVVAGDIRDAHYEACRYANGHYVCTPTRDADVVINNTFPQSLQGNLGLGLITSSVRDGGSGVLVIQNPMGISTMHYLEENRAFKVGSYWDTFAATAQPRRVGQLIVFSQYLQKRDMMLFDSPNTKFARSWQEVLAYLEPAHRESTRVAVYPCGPVQHAPFDIV